MTWDIQYRQQPACGSGCGCEEWGVTLIGSQGLEMEKSLESKKSSNNEARLQLTSDKLPRRSTWDFGLETCEIRSAAVESFAIMLASILSPFFRGMA
ncbi:MAG TPA: hypothetical protein VLU73_11940 [Methylococcaceae bacterium]|nr:hypothetical protein [Methylococcaceae bacterium]